MDLNAISCKMCRNEFEIDLSYFSMFFYSGFHIYPGECPSHTHKTKFVFLHLKVPVYLHNYKMHSHPAFTLLPQDAGESKCPCRN